MTALVLVTDMPGGSDARAASVSFEMPKSSTLITNCPSLLRNAKEVRRLQVAMDDAEAVSVGDRDGGLQEKVDRLVNRKRAPLLQPNRGSPLQVFHDHVRSAVVQGTHVENAGDVLVLDPDGGPRFARESRDGFLVVEQRGQKKLEGHAAVELDVACRDDHTHAAYAEDALDAVLAREDFTLAHSGKLLAILVRHFVRPSDVVPAVALPGAYSSAARTFAANAFAHKVPRIRSRGRALPRRERLPQKMDIAE